MLATLRQRNFALVWLGGLVSMTGDWLLFAALPVYIYQQTGSALATSVMFMTYWIPDAFLGSIAGVFVDRWDRRRTIIASNVLMALSLLPLMALVLAPSRELLWVPYAVKLVQSTIGLFPGPAEGALLPTLVGEDRLVPANSLNALNNSIARFAGPPLGGVLVGVFGLGGVVLVDCLTFMFAAAMVWLVSIAPSTAGTQAEAQEGGLAGMVVGRWTSVWREWLEGLRVIARSRLLAVLFLVTAIRTFGNGIFSPLLVPFVQDTLRGGATGYGLLLTAEGIGGLIGGTVVGRWGAALSPRQLVVLGVMATGPILLLMFNVPSLPLAVALMALVAVPFVASEVGRNTLLQAGVTDRYRGRVLAASGTTIAFLSLSGAAVAGTLGDALGVVPMLHVYAALSILAGLVALKLPAAAPGANRDAALSRS